MFSLIIVIISIALVAALALATMYFGGSAFNKGGSSATSARLANEGTQLRGTLALYHQETGEKASAFEQLVTSQHLSGRIEGWNFADDVIWQTITDEAVCTEINTRAGYATSPSCSDPDIANKTVCCEMD